MWLIAGVLVVIGLPVVATAPLPSGSLRDVADRFAPSGLASPVTDTYEPRRLLCLGDNPCPSVARSWVLDELVSTSEVQSWLSAADIEAEVDGECGSGSCSARGTADGWRVTLYVSTPHPDEASRMSLHLRP